MPSCRITNYTSQPLNVSLKHLCALHFENEVAPGQTVKLKPGRVWFTLEVLVDDKDNRYSVAQSAAAIAIVSLACVGTAAAAIPAAAALGGATMGTAIGGTVSTIGTTIGSTVSSTVIASGTGLLVAGETMLAGFGAAYTAASAFLGAHAVTAAKLSAAFLPKAIEVVEKEVGGFNAVQKEVIAILSSPTVTEDVRNEGLSILSRLGLAVAADRAAAAAAEEEEKEKVAKPGPSHERESSSNSVNSDSGSSSGSASNTNTNTTRPSLKRMQTSVSTLMHKLSSESRTERKLAKQEAKEAKQVASWEVVDVDVDKESGMLSTKERLRIHGLFMNERRHFEVREKEGKLVLMDANTKEAVMG